MIRILQIGNLALHGYAEPDLDEDFEGIGKTTQFINSATVLRPSARFITKPRKLKFDIQLYNDEYRTREAIYQRLLNLANMDTDIIAFDDMSAGVDVSRDKYSRFDFPTEEILWLHTRGQIRHISKKSDNRKHTIQIEIEMNPYWTPLSNMQWQTVKTTDATSYYLNEQTLSAPYTPTPFPTAKELTSIIKKRPKMFHRTIFTNWGQQYEPEWYEANQKKTPNLPKLGTYTNWSTTTSQTLPIYIDPNHWGMPPKVNYIFKNLPASGTITIEVLRQSSSLWQGETATWTIDLAEVDTAVTEAGYTTESTDKLILGDTIFSEGFVLRDETKLTQVADSVSSDKEGWVGQILPGDNRITITVPSGVSWFIGSTNRRA